MKFNGKPLVKLNPEPLEADLLPVKEDGRWCFTLPEGRKFRILQLTDVHIGGGLLSYKKDIAAANAVIRTVNAAKPDLIIVTGDMVYPIPVFSGSRNNLKSTKTFIKLMEGFCLPWAVVFGNHDEEKSSTHKKSRLSEEYERAAYSLFQRGEPSITGEGNYSVLLKNADGTLNTALMMIDSNMYLGRGFYSGFDIIHDDQTEWYKREIAKLSGGGPSVGSMAFFHIPPKEFKLAWEKCYKGNFDEVTYHGGFVGEKDNYFGYPKTKECSFFSEMVKLGGVKAMFMGHDHLSTLSLTYKGIRLTYGMSIDYLAYFGIKKKHTQRGGTVIEIDGKGDFTVTMLPLDEVENDV